MADRIDNFNELAPLSAVTYAEICLRARGLEPHDLGSWPPESIELLEMWLDACETGSFYARELFERGQFMFGYVLENICNYTVTFGERTAIRPGQRIVRANISIECAKFIERGWIKTAPTILRSPRWLSATQLEFRVGETAFVAPLPPKIEATEDFVAGLIRSVDHTFHGRVLFDVIELRADVTDFVARILAVALERGDPRVRRIA